MNWIEINEYLNFFKEIIDEIEMLEELLENNDTTRSDRTS